MTGDAPQPGEKPRNQGEPWALTDPDPGWWRGGRDREPPAGPPVEKPAGPGPRHAEDAAEARAAGVRDLTDGSRLATAGELMIIEPDSRDLAPAVLEGVGEEEPATDRNRPTVILNAQRPLPDVPVSPEVEARLERLENSPFWMSEQERNAADQSRPPAHRAGGPRRRPPAHNPVGPMVALVMLSLLAAFFAWVSAEPFWLAVGHGDDGRATITRCHGDGLAQRCAGQFTSDDGSFTAAPVTLLGISGASRATGAITPARMVSPGSDQAYAGPAGTLMNLRWILGFALVLICGFGIVRSTGANRLESGMRRRRAVLLSFAAPILLQAGFLAAAF